MRLIDADALIARWKAAMLHMTTVVDGKHPISIETLIEDVGKFPTIDPESLRPQGEWVDAEDGDGIVCPACGVDFCVLTNETERFNCCPNCGAKMKGAENNG